MGRRLTRRSSRRRFASRLRAKDVVQITMIGRVLGVSGISGRGVLLHLGAAMLACAIVPHVLDGPAWGSLIGFGSVGVVALCVAPFAPRVRRLPTQHLGLSWGSSIVTLVTGGFLFALACELGDSMIGFASVWSLVFGVASVVGLRAAERQTVQPDDAADDAAHRS